MKLLSDKRIAVFGAGAVGCYFGRFFTEAGFDTEFIARGGRLEALKAGGLFVEGRDEALLHVDVKACGELNGLYDAVLVCVKSQDTPSAALAVKGHLKEGGFAVSLQNGVENPGVLASVLGSGKVVPAAVYLTASMKGGNRLSFVSRGKVVYGFYGREGEKAAEAFGEMLSHTDLNYEKRRDIKAEQWKKLCLNAAMNPLSALFRMDFGSILANKDVMDLAKALFEEVREAAFIEGIEIGESEFDDIKRRCGLNPSFKTSMLQDIEAGRHPETDAVLGTAARILAGAGKASPYSDMLLKIMNVKFGGWFQISPKLAADVIVVDGDNVLLVERKNRPYGWAVPGGFVNLYETIERAASRELMEETGIEAPVDRLELLGIYSDPARDFRGHTVSAVYVFKGGGEPSAGDDAKSARYFHIDGLPDDIAFDHRKVLMDCKKKYRL